MYTFENTVDYRNSSSPVRPIPLPPIYGLSRLLRQPPLMDTIQIGGHKPNKYDLKSVTSKNISHIFRDPFCELSFVEDKSRKGKRVIACIEDNWTVTVMMAPSGFAIKDDTKYKSLAKSYLMQCTNVTSSKVGFLCIARRNVAIGSKRQIATTDPQRSDL